MKKYLYLIVLFCFAGITHAQHRLESQLNMFRAEDVIIKQQVGYKDPGRIGANVLWDFSQLSIENEEYELIYSTRDEQIITGAEHLTRYHYQLAGDSLLLWGFDNQSTRLRNKQAELLLQFPANYGDSITSYYYGHGNYGNRLELDVMGTISCQVDAYGMMILPNQDTLKQVIRTRTLKYIAEDTKPISPEYMQKDTAHYVITPDSIDFRLANDTVIFVVETFRWYAKGYRYPVFETVRSWEEYRSDADVEFLHIAFFFPPQEHYYLDKDEENLAVLEEENEDDKIIDPWEGLSYNIFPNPVKNSDLSVEIYLPKRADNIHIQLRNTMGLLVSEKKYGSYPQGTHAFRVDALMLPVGNYILEINLDDKLISEIIMKR
jgi:hypothetical protein